jgi:Flp pilus assembly protein TadG
LGVLSRYIRCRTGNVAITFALALIPLLLAAGMAIDYVRAISAQGVLQSAVDSAVLAAGASDKVNASDIEKLVKDYLAGNKYDLHLISVDPVTVLKGSSSGDYSVTVSGKVNTTFMALAGYITMDVGATAGIVRGSGEAPLEVALVLDTTGSMSGSKIDTLKTAAKNLAGSVMDAVKDAKIGIVPFSYYVNVGVSHRHDSWMSVPADYTDPPACYDTYPNRSGCTTSYGTCYSDGVPYTCSWEDCTSMGAPVPQCYGAYTHKWWGCVGSRAEPLNASIGTLSTPYPGFLETSCADALTDLTGAKGALNAAIDHLSAYGDTFIPGGLLWGWNILDPGVPFTNGASYADIAAKGGKKAMVLMTDGANTLAEDSDGTHGGCLPDCSATDTLMLQLCQNIKDSGIILYTVLFDVTDPDIQARLDECASDTSKSFVAADNAGLISAFGKIGKSLTSLRLSK